MIEKEIEISNLFQEKFSQVTGDPVQKLRKTVKILRDEEFLITSAFGTGIKIGNDVVQLHELRVDEKKIRFICTDEYFESNAIDNIFVFSPAFANCQLLDIRMTNGLSAAVHCLPHIAYIEEKISLFDNIKSICIVGKQSYMYADQLEANNVRVSFIDVPVKTYHFQFFGHYKADGSVNLLVESQYNNEIIHESN